jgi:serine/threonine-protein kinase
MDTTVGADPLVGQVLDGRYRIESRIAKGGMATVYVAGDLKLGRQVAVKVMHANMAQDEEFVRRFMGEAKAAALLSHPNVVAVYDQGTSIPHVYLVMEYVPGRTLRDILNERGRLGPRSALALMQHILSALAAAHRAGLVHRDVKPENVLITDDGQVKVADFGLARAETASKQTKTGLIIGTVAYMAPEQVLQASADSRSDVYAAGILLFELLTGIQPHQAESPLAVAYKHVNEVVPLPSSVLPGIPGQLDALVAAATARDPGRRPDDAGRFLGAVVEVERTLPADIDQRLAGATPVSRTGTAVLAVSPMPGLRTTTADGLTGPPPGHPSHPGYPTVQADGQHTALLPGMPEDFGTRPRPTGDEASGFNRTLAALTSRYVLIAVGLVAVVILGAAFWYQTSGQYQKVPNVVGLQLSEAKAELQGKGYHVLTGTARHSKQYPQGDIVATDPVAGSRIAKNGNVTLFPSSGPPLVPIPSLQGRTLTEAQQALSALGLNNVQANEQSASVPVGQVTRTVPPANSQVQPGPSGQTVTIYISSGIPVPNVVGQNGDTAQEILRRAGFTNIQVNKQDPQGNQPPNTVLQENPPAGSSANAGDTITLIITNKKCTVNFGPIHAFCDNGNGGGQGNGNGGQGNPNGGNPGGGDPNNPGNGNGDNNGGGDNGGN